MKVNVSTAVPKRKYRHDISSRHITTLAVNDLRVTNIIECIKGDRIVCDINQFVRLAPMVVPTFGSFKVHTYAFWIPYRSIWHHYGEYLSNTSDASFNGIKNPLNMRLYDIMKLFVQIGSGLPTVRTGYTTAATSSANADLTFVLAGASTAAQFNLTARGRLLWNNLQALGYGLPTYIDYSDDSTQTDKYNYMYAENYSLFPLLALARVFYDYMYPSAYVTQQGFGDLFLDSLWEQWDETLTPNGRQTVMSNIDALLINCYDRDFYTSLWSQPNQVASSGNSGNFPALESLVTSSASLKVDSSFNGARVYQNNASQAYTLSAQSLRWLQSVSDFVQRNNIGGSRVREYLRAHFGFASSEEKGDISQFIKSYTSDVVIQDVTNTADSAGTALGVQGGKGYSAGQGTLKFESSENGILLFVTSVVPQIGYYQGTKPLCRDVKSRFDYYTPEFDGQSMEAVPRRGLFSQYRDASDVSKVSIASLGDVFGFAPIYSERYKIRQDYLTGDFLFNSRNNSHGLDSYHTFRDVLYGRNNLALDARFIATDNQTQRIFSFVGGSGSTPSSVAQWDKLFAFFRFDCTRYSSALSLSESLPMFDKSGKDVGLQYEGEQL